jgi:hypothetical protein
MLKRLMKLFTCLLMTSISDNAFATIIYLPAIRNVMAGSSSSGNDQVWLRIDGQPTNVPAECVYGSWSLFYIANDGAVDPGKALSILLSAQLTHQPIALDFSIQTGASDFFNWGITKCKVSRLSTGQ